MAHALSASRRPIRRLALALIACLPLVATFAAPAGAAVDYYSDTGVPRDAYHRGTLTYWAQQDKFSTDMYLYDVAQDSAGVIGSFATEYVNGDVGYTLNTYWGGGAGTGHSFHVEYNRPKKVSRANPTTCLSDNGDVFQCVTYRGPKSPHN